MKGLIITSILTVLTLTVNGQAFDSDIKIGDTLSTHGKVLGVITDIKTVSNGTDNVRQIYLINEYKISKAYRKALSKEIFSRYGVMSEIIVSLASQSKELSAGDHLIMSAKHSKEGKIIGLAGVGLGVGLAFVLPPLGIAVGLIGVTVASIKFFKADKELRKAGLKMKGSN